MATCTQCGAELKPGVMHIGGESLLNLPQQEAVWFEMTQE